MRLDIRDVIRYSLGFESTNQYEPFFFSFRATYVELHPISGDLQINVIQLHKRFVDMGQNLSCSIIRFQESMNNGLEHVLVSASKLMPINLQNPEQLVHPITDSQ